jgi:hypothetical protein
MVFRKSFPKSNDRYPVWEEVVLSDEEENAVEEVARQANIKLMEECVADAKKLVMNEELSKEDIVRLAISLFEKRSSHSVYWKERKCREKFDSLNPKN